LQLISHSDDNVSVLFPFARICRCGEYLSFTLQDFIANDDNSGSFEPAAGTTFCGGGHCRHFTTVTKTPENGHNSPSYATLRMEDHSETDPEHFYILKQV
jgi:hypothetical protein